MTRTKKKRKRAAFSAHINSKVFMEYGATQTVNRVRNEISEKEKENIDTVTVIRPPDGHSSFFRALP